MLTVEHENHSVGTGTFYSWQRIDRHGPNLISREFYRDKIVVGVKHVLFNCPPLCIGLPAAFQNGKIADAGVRRTSLNFLDNVQCDVSHP